MGIVMVLESKEHLKTFAEHAAHLRWAYLGKSGPSSANLKTRLHDRRVAISDDSLAFNIEF